MIPKWLTDIYTRFGWLQALIVIVVIALLIAGATYTGLDVEWLIALFEGG